jgi:hypothetical protein
MRRHVRRLPRQRNRRPGGLEIASVSPEISGEISPINRPSRAARVHDRLAIGRTGAASFKALGLM